MPKYDVYAVDGDLNNQLLLVERDGWQVINGGYHCKYIDDNELELPTGDHAFLIHQMETHLEFDRYETILADAKFAIQNGGLDYL